MCERFRNDQSFETDIILGDTDIRRYGIYYCDLEEDLNPDSNNRALIGKCNRPCMVITPTNYNRKKNKIIVIPFCSNNTDLSDEEFVENSYKMADRDVLIPIKLNRDEMSFLVVSQPRAIYKRNIGRYIGRLDKRKSPEIVRSIMRELNYLMIDDYIDESLQTRLDTSALYDIRTMPKESLVDYLKTRDDLSDILKGNDAVTTKKKYVRLSNEEFAPYYVKYRNGEMTPREISAETGISYGTCIRKIHDAENYLNNNK